MKVDPGSEFDDRFGDRWFPDLSCHQEGHHRWKRLRDGCTLEVVGDRVEIAWTLNHFVQYPTDDPLGWIGSHIYGRPGPVAAVVVQ